MGTPEFGQGEIATSRPSPLSEAIARAVDRHSTAFVTAHSNAVLFSQQMREEGLTATGSERAAEVMGGHLLDQASALLSIRRLAYPPIHDASNELHIPSNDERLGRAGTVSENPTMIFSEFSSSQA